MAPSRSSVLVAEQHQHQPHTKNHQNHGHAHSPAHAPLPGLLARAARLVPPVELLGFLKDHRDIFRRHWCEAHRHDPAGLKNGLCFMLEMEILLGALFLGFSGGVFFSVMDETISQRFANLEWSTVEFWIAVFGTLAVVVDMQFIACAYIALIITQPVSTANIYTYARSPTTNHTFLLTSRLLIVMLYSTTAFMCLAVVYTLGSGWPAVVLVTCSVIPVFTTFVVYCGTCVNQTMYSGAWGPYDIMPDPANAHQMTPEECEAVYYGRALEARKWSASEGGDEPLRFYERLHEEFGHRRSRGGRGGEGEGSSNARQEGQRGSRRRDEAGGGDEEGEGGEGAPRGLTASGRQARREARTHTRTGPSSFRSIVDGGEGGGGGKAVGVSEQGYSRVVMTEAAAASLVLSGGSSPL